MENLLRSGPLKAGLVLALMGLAGCQTGGTAASSTIEEDDLNATPSAFAATPAAPGLCAIELASGPPPKPAKGADIAKGLGKNVARNVGRNILANTIGGGAIGATVASQVVRTEQDLGGKWMVTDGSSNCACEIRVRTGAGVVATGFGRASGYKLRDAKGGSMQNMSCSNPRLTQVARFALGYSFTGYDAKLAVESASGAAIAEMNRDGVNYFSGTLSDGTPVTMWRRMGG
ncbi:MAG: hypothetical protein WA921_11510 [Ahrensia sp.]